MGDSWTPLKLLDWAWAIILLVFTWWHNQNQTKLKEITEAINCKADKDQLNEHRDDINMLANKIQVLELALTEIKATGGRIISHLDSEQRTRTETNREILNNLRILMERRRHER